jgi:hypothetical protein
VAWSTGATCTQRPAEPAPGYTTCDITFAVTSLVQAYRDGADIDARIAVLATYLGHVNPVSTYYYLHASPELMTLALERLTTHYSATAVPR